MGTGVADKQIEPRVARVGLGRAPLDRHRDRLAPAGRFEEARPGDSGGRRSLAVNLLDDVARHQAGSGRGRSRLRIVVVFGGRCRQHDAQGRRVRVEHAARREPETIERLKHVVVDLGGVRQAPFGGRLPRLLDQFLGVVGVRRGKSNRQ